MGNDELSSYEAFGGQDALQSRHGLQSLALVAGISKKVVEVAGFEPAVSCPPDRRDNQASLYLDGPAFFLERKKAFRPARTVPK